MFLNNRHEPTTKKLLLVQPSRPHHMRKSRPVPTITAETQLVSLIIKNPKHNKQPYS